MVETPYSSLSDEDLMDRVCQDSADAYEVLVLRFQARLFHFALRRMRDRQLAEDMVQDTLLKAWRHRQSFHRGSRLSTWLFALCLNNCRDQWRRQKPESSLERPEVALAAEHSLLRPRDPSPAVQAAQHELSQALLEAVECLAPQTAELLKLRSREDITLEDAGREVGLSPQAARAAASRGYKKLKELLKNKVD